MGSKFFILNMYAYHTTYLIIVCNGQTIDWNLIDCLYQKNFNPDSGISFVPKLKREHVFLTSFSKMRVDLATQVSLSMHL